ncbi:MAG: hypothetical protein AB8B97_06715, partial [Granulosicoccus sp.]
MSRDEQSDHLNLSLDNEEGAPLQQLQGHSITYRIAMGPQAGRPRLPSNSRYRESVTPLSARQVKPATADVEADGPDE